MATDKTNKNNVETENETDKVTKTKAESKPDKPDRIRQANRTK
jgi:hypothetical protein